MLPSELRPEDFGGYPPMARKLVIDNLAALRQLPLSILPNLLREVIDYDYKFPVERKSLERELANLSSLSAEGHKEWFGAFAEIRLSATLEKFDWVNFPAQYVEQLSAHLWSTHQQDAFRKAALDYGNRLHSAAPPDPLPVQRLGITVVGQGVTSTAVPLFRRLRAHGVYYTSVSPENGLQQVLEFAAARTKAQPVPYAHWYIDGGQEDRYDPSLTCVSYHSLAAARTALSLTFQKQIEQPGMGPEALRTVMAKLRPADLGLDRISDPILARFELKLLTEGSGTQIFSTTFAQWAARETLRRAQPLTLVVRFAPRQRQRPMNELLYGKKEAVEMDPAGSLVDADMGAYYNWLNQQRLPGAEQSAFVVWFEGHNEAVAIGPDLPRGTVSSNSATLKQILNRALS
jgi:hypothetical protein